MIASAATCQVTATYDKPGFIVAEVFSPRGESNANSIRGTSWFDGSCFGSLPGVNRLVRYRVLNSSANPQCSVSTLRVTIGLSCPVCSSVSKFIELPVIGCSSVIAPVMPNGRSHARLSGRSPKPLPKKMPGVIKSGALAPTPLAPECPMPHPNPADTNISCRSFLYTSLLIVRFVESNPDRWETPQLR